MSVLRRMPLKRYHAFASCETPGCFSSRHSMAEPVEIWNHRTPPPATARLLEWAREALRTEKEMYGEPYHDSQFTIGSPLVGVVRKFVEEWEPKP